MPYSRIFNDLHFNHTEYCGKGSNIMKLKSWFQELKGKLKYELELRSPQMYLRSYQIDAETEKLLSAKLTVSMVTAVMALQHTSWDIKAAKLSCKFRENSPEKKDFKFTKAVHGIFFVTSDPDESSLKSFNQNYETQELNLCFWRMTVENERYIFKHSVWLIWTNTNKTRNTSHWAW